MDVTQLNSRELEQNERRIAYEIKALGDPPTLENLETNKSRWVNAVLTSIQAFGRILTLMVATAIQSLASILLLIVFSQLEYWRVVHGAIALGQSEQQASLIALAVVVANVVHPIMTISGKRGETHHQATSPTLRGWLGALGRRIFGKPKTKQVAWSANPTLEISALILTWTTIALAVTDLVAPLITAVATGTTDKPNIILMTELVIGLGLSIGGVLFLQAISADIGARILRDSSREQLVEKRRVYDEKVAEIRQRVTADSMRAKIADKARKASMTGKEGTEANNPVRPLVNKDKQDTNGRGVNG